MIDGDSARDDSNYNEVEWISDDEEYFNEPKRSLSGTLQEPGP
jgi:hypothetical protein